MPIDQTTARANTRHLILLRGMTIKELAERAGLSKETLYGWSKPDRPKDLGAKSLAAIADALGVTTAELFSPDLAAPVDKITAEDYSPANVTTQIPTLEEWREGIRTIERYVRSIEDPEERLAEVRRLLAIAQDDVGAYERRLEQRRASRSTRVGSGGNARTPSRRSG